MAARAEVPCPELVAGFAGSYNSYCMLSGRIKKDRKKGFLRESEGKAKNSCQCHETEIDHQI